MSEQSAPPPPGSRAIKIPVHTSINTDYASSRRRRRERTSKAREQAESSDAGPSSLTSEDSPWCYSPTPGGSGGGSSGSGKEALQSVASPSMQGNRFGLPTASDDHTKRKDKQKASYPPPATMPTLYNPSSSPLGPSMLQSSSYKSINLNSRHDDPDEPPRLITYTKHSQGFTWNDELFLPSYMLGRYGGGGRKKQYDGDFGDDDACPVAEIFVTDEEAQAMMP